MYKSFRRGVNGFIPDRAEGSQAGYIQDVGFLLSPLVGEQLVRKQRRCHYVQLNDAVYIVRGCLIKPDSSTNARIVDQHTHFKLCIDLACQLQHIFAAGEICFKKMSLHVIVKSQLVTKLTKALPRQADKNKVVSLLCQLCRKCFSKALARTCHYCISWMHIIRFSNNEITGRRFRNGAIL